MMPFDFNSMAQQCAPNVHPTTLQAVVRTESGFNPYAIGVVGGRLVRQPRDRDEAVATAKALEAQGINFSMGLGQVNRTNLARYGLTYETAFDPCANLRAGSAILHDCYERATAAMGQGTPALRAAISCYYSGNFTRGETADAGGTSYVQRVVANAQMAAGSTNVVPAIPVVMDSQSGRPAHATASDARTSSAQRSGPKQRQAGPHPSWDAFGDFTCDDDCN
ncbi:lytic transglycosylase domain-containing protein [Paraburkholderia fungorum]|uniref:lytic transglycosylase domain-containing protein n=1 Tax=Paraburkholderia fungorum TaxID=134537 RepID=UPI001C1E9FED|nr:lytic transglycosylase domain-containing protein [Paraburkholderia fungorum]MBU7442673.1 lytic transglycosylase domain-containing protein [Paraburkholderia fungorum]